MYSSGSDSQMSRTFFCKAAEARLKSTKIARIGVSPLNLQRILIARLRHQPTLRRSFCVADSMPDFDSMLRTQASEFRTAALMLINSPLKAVSTQARTSVEFTFSLGRSLTVTEARPNSSAVPFTNSDFQCGPQWYDPLAFQMPIDLDGLSWRRA